mmetsp:Transcript_16893/g.44363  ORF Transcript_16893/g.44363 Transcript_16893/m.44363 type:complete len:123 (+) Transcript_16893:873-1241(+)
MTRRRLRCQLLRRRLLFLLPERHRLLQKKKPVFQRPRDKLRDNRRRRAQEILKQQAAESAERERVETLYVGAGLSLLGLAVLVFFLDFLFYVGFWRCFKPLASVFGGYFYYALSAEPPSSRK